ncbi:MAG: glutamate--tRNA ligase [Alphaproteobacteria bacterium]|nr:glutamate--tRNA ligase [Alphaproteobacteria bacterium]
MKQEIIDLVFPNPLPTPEELETKYPVRNLLQGAQVTRIAPSPTGMMHVGTVYGALIDERLAHQSGGVFMLRLEDTDQKREVKEAVDLILRVFNDCQILNDEGPVFGREEQGNYGPYFQSARKEIYHAFVKKLLQEDKAYLCFCNEEENARLHDMQAKANVRGGYYGAFAKCRKLTEDEILENLKAGKSFVVRFKSMGHYSQKIVLSDVVRGKREFPQNDLDVVIMKGDGLPTYHFAHAVDDHLMRTTTVVRGDEWLSTWPLHAQLFEALGWDMPKYIHTATIQKIDEKGNRRKLSKRLDPEANAMSFSENGYPRTALIEYLLNLANSNFEDWRRANPNAPYQDFPFSAKKLGTSGALFDFVKLDSISRDIIGRMSAEEVYNETLAWCEKYDADFAVVMKENADYMKQILDIERSGVKKVRKDITKWSDVKKESLFFFDNQFTQSKESILEQLKSLSINDINDIVDVFNKLYDINDEKDAWFEKVKQVAQKVGFTCDMKAYKANPEAFKGNVSDVATVLRVFITGRTQSPDLYAIMKVMGKERISKRLTRI